MVWGTEYSTPRGASPQERSDRLRFFRWSRGCFKRQMGWFLDVQQLWTVAFWSLIRLCHFISVLVATPQKCRAPHKSQVRNFVKGKKTPALEPPRSLAKCCDSSVISMDQGDATPSFKKDVPFGNLTWQWQTHENHENPIFIIDGFFHQSCHLYRIPHYYVWFPDGSMGLSNNKRWSHPFCWLNPDFQKKKNLP